jgi:hypothetical protein
MKNNNTNTQKVTVTSLTDTELFDEAFKVACETYEPFGFFSPAHGCLHNVDLGIELLPFFERGEETPTQYAMRSAFEAGRQLGRKEAQQSEEARDGYAR